MAGRECLKGWILTPSPTDGSDVPFFVNVREEEIVWKKPSISEKIMEGLVDVEVCNPVPEIRCKKDNWNITLREDGSCVINTKISIGRYFQEDDSNSLRSIVKLPFKLMNNENFTFQCSKLADKIEIISSTISVLPEQDREIDELEFIIYNNNEVFNSFNSSATYNENFICVSVSGNIVL